MKNTFYLKLFLFLTLSLAVSCNKKNKEVSATEDVNDSIKSQNKKADLKSDKNPPAWAPSMHSEMQLVIEKLESLGGKPVETLSAKEARLQPTPTDTVMAVMRDKNMSMTKPLCDTIGKTIPITGGSTHIRIYTPKDKKPNYPIIVYYHGGGFVIANIDVYSASAQGLCEQVGAIVVSVEYPKGPEKKFPAAHMAAFDAYRWILKNAASFNGDATKIAVVGESAGGNLAINVSMMARDKKLQLPLCQILVYPIANNDMNSESYVKYAMAKPLNKAMMQWFLKNYLPNESMSADPKISVVKANLRGLPKTVIIGAEIDVLQSEGKLLADKLKQANVNTDYKLYEGVTHEFFGMASVIPEAKEAQKMAANNLKTALGL